MNAEYYFLALMRTSGVFLLTPVFADVAIPAQVRILLILALSWSIQPFAKQYIEIDDFLWAVIMEFCFGACLGLLIRLIYSTMDILGNIISLNIGLSAATVFNPNFSEQTSIISSFFNIAGLGIVFASDLHLKFILALANSYQISFQPDFMVILNSISRSFVVALEMSLPFIVLGIIWQLGLGLLNRVFSQLQIFFVAIPLQLYLGLGLLLFTIMGILGAMMYQLEQFING